MKLVHILRAFIVLALTLLLTSPKYILADDIKGTAEFTGEANPGFLKIHGSGGKVVGQILSKEAGIVSATFKVKVDDFTTDLSLRDDHMKNKYLEMSKFPEIILSIKSYKIWEPKFSGELTLHGQTHAVAGTIEHNGKNVKAMFDVKVTDYGIPKPSHLGVGMEEIVKAIVEFEYE